MPHNVLPLELLKNGEEGRVFEIDGDRGLVSRLAEMGLREGVRIRMIRCGAPCIVAIDHQRLSFRAEDAAMILVETAS